MTGRSYADALTDQRIAERGARPYPERITFALDAPAAPGATGPLEGPGVDEFCGVAEPTVDLWETGELVPTAEQLEALATLTGYPVPFFFAEPPPPFDGPGWLCIRSGKGRGCYPLHGELPDDDPEQLAIRAENIIPGNMPARPPAPRPDAPPPGPLPECSGPCGRPMRRATWVAQHGRCARCGPERTRS
jgi:transcriptional regulator with XRE-family HTH domain